MLKRVGRIYDSYEGRPLYEYPCIYFPAGDYCCHFSCRMKALRDAGYTQVADRLEQNDKARDWLHSWGKLLYDPGRHGRDKARRKSVAQIIIAMRRGECAYVDAVYAGAWTGAILPN